MSGGDRNVLATRQKEGGSKKDKKIVGVFSMEGRAETVQVNLPDGAYTNLIDGSHFDVFERTLALNGEPVIVEI